MEGSFSFRKTVIALAALALVTAACGAADDAESTTATSHPTTLGPSTTSSETTAPAATVPDRDDRDPGNLPERVPAEAGGSTVTGEVPEPLLDRVIADAASRARVEPSTVIVVTAQEMMWPDGSLGCAEPGGIYTQAIVPGYWVVVEAGGVAYDYRLDDGDFLKLCTSPLPGPGDTVPES